jgi:peptidoglycan-associated lipoprotein
MDQLEAHGEYLADNPDRQMLVEGHTDERGAREYNLALGERRAEAVKQALTLAGADEAQVDTVSYGEESPAVSGSSESAWAENRRAELVYER